MRYRNEEIVEVDKNFRLVKTLSNAIVDDNFIEDLLNTPSIVPKGNVETRWGSVLKMIESFVAARLAVNEVLKNIDGKADNTISKTEELLLLDLITILKPLDELTTNLQSITDGMFCFPFILYD